LNGDVIFFTRSSIPFFREQIDVPVYRQTGIMAFRKDALTKFSALSATALEKAESVDMLRAIRTWNAHPRGCSRLSNDRCRQIHPMLAWWKRPLKTDKVQQELFNQLPGNIT
jgi:hypothetical protein